MTSEIPIEINSLAFGLLGDTARVEAVFMVAFRGASGRNAARATGVPKTTIVRDRARFRARLEAYREKTGRRQASGGEEKKPSAISH